MLTHDGLPQVCQSQDLRLGQRAGRFRVVAHQRSGALVGEHHEGGSGARTALVREGQSGQDKEIRKMPVLEVRVHDAAIGRRRDDRAVLHVRGGFQNGATEKKVS